MSSLSDLYGLQTLERLLLFSRMPIAVTGVQRGCARASEHAEATRKQPYRIMN